ncbi:regulator of nucleoside diphosphate kinase [Variovorax sp. HW608]|uniref:GreA/GreB family elongation factor n=1 Tax=Variovorax sp. HW608 TaxID=1034889 RepID=UPI00081FA7F3|nr:GreA/GreB family elongation factor [Variovorax sp. HW608]SCK51860.1 regulator of nucleoside diphosphate kinase [Variovorax sp. HW608]
MTATIHGERVLTELDHVRLRKLQGARAHPALESLLDLAEVTRSREVPADIVTMHSKITIVDAQTGQRDQMTLCYPPEADPAKGFLSVLSPVGMSLIGLRLGAVAHWNTPGGEARSARVEEILFQPEASGEYTL